MTVYFAWINKEEIFDPKKHARQDIPIFHLSIQQKENGFAFACIRTSFISLLYEKQAFISYKNSKNKVILLFKGRLWNTPTKIDGKILQFELTAEPENAYQYIQKIHDALKKTPYWDPLFVSLIKRERPSESLESQSVLYCWSRTNTHVILSDIFQGGNLRNIGRNIWDETLTLNYNKTPLSYITVHVEAQWVQYHWGIIDVGKFLQNRSALGMISSFTGNDLQQRWPLIGKALNKSGYKVIHSYLKEINPANNSSLHFYPSVSPCFKEYQGSHFKDVYFKRFWFKPELLLAWQYHQKRKEIVKITLKNSVQGIKKTGQNHKEIFLKLGNLCADRPIYPWKSDHSYALFDLVEYQSRIYRCYQSNTTVCPPSAPWVLEDHPTGLKNPAQSTFFLTDRGYQAVAHAIDIARAHLAASSRAIKITFKTNWEVLDDVSLDHTLTIEDSRLPAGKATGKVAEYQFVAEEQKRWISIVLLCAVGQPLEAPKIPGPVSSLYSQEEYLEPEQMPVSPCGILFPRFDDQGPIRGLLAPWKLKIHDFIRQSTIDNTADQQLKVLQTLVAPESIAKELKKIPTKIRLPLKSLTTQTCLTHEIRLDIPNPWAPPCQIILEKN